MMKEVECPQSRISLKFIFKSLSDLTYQKYDQIKKTDQDPQKWWRQELWDLTDALLNDYAPNYNYDWRSEIGYNLYDEEEAQKIQEYMNFFEKVILDELDYDFVYDEKSPESYLDYPKWPLIIEGAKEVYAMMFNKNKEYHFTEFLEIYEKKYWEKREKEIAEEEKSKIND